MLEILSSSNGIDRVTNDNFIFFIAVIILCTNNSSFQSFLHCIIITKQSFSNHISQNKIDYGPKLRLHVYLRANSA